MTRRLAIVEPSTPDTDALEVLARALAPRIARLLAADHRGSGLVDVVAAVPAPRRTVMRACRTGAIIGAVKIGRRWCAPREAVEAWSRASGPCPVPARDDTSDLEPLRHRLARTL